LQKLETFSWNDSSVLKNSSLAPFMLMLSKRFEQLRPQDNTDDFRSRLKWSIANILRKINIQQGDYETALSWANREVDSASHIGSDLMRASYFHIASVEVHKNNFDEASKQVEIAYQHHARAIFTHLTKVNFMDVDEQFIDSMEELGAVLSAKNQHKQAAEFYEDESQLPRLGARIKCTALINSGDQFLQIPDYSKALKVYKLAADLDAAQVGAANHDKAVASVQAATAKLAPARRNGTSRLHG
jgi:tetratricopeptide (TPR) repeat protein